jgi:hypothetical protein
VEKADQPCVPLVVEGKELPRLKLDGLDERSTQETLHGIDQCIERQIVRNNYYDS